MERLSSQTTDNVHAFLMLPPLQKFNFFPFIFLFLWFIQLHVYPNPLEQWVTWTVNIEPYLLVIWRLLSPGYDVCGWLGVKCRESVDWKNGPMVHDKVISNRSISTALSRKGPAPDRHVLNCWRHLSAHAVHAPRHLQSPHAITRLSAFHACLALNVHRCVL